jgi:Terpene cyclase DEP1
MVSLIVHAVLGLTVIGLIVASNPHIFRRTPTGPALSLMECLYYVVGIASVALGWYFNIRFVREYSHGATNPIWGPGSWADYIRLMFVNPAASSASQDYTIANVILLPLFTIVDGYRRGVRRPWLYFLSSLLTSFAFAWAFYLATIERQRRLGAEIEPTSTPTRTSSA